MAFFILNNIVMPNHIKNKLKINGTKEQIKFIFDKYNIHIKAQHYKTHDERKVICRNAKEDKFSVGWLDLSNGEFTTREENSLRIGLPEGWEIEINEAKDCFPAFDKIITPPDCDEYKDIPSQHAVSNHPNWWRTCNIKNWGTKWGGYAYLTEEFGTYTFETAWNGVPDLMLELSKQNPDVEFEYTYADEDTGCNVGKFIFKGGKIISTYLPPNISQPAYEIAFGLRPEVREYYELVGGMYRHKEDED